MTNTSTVKDPKQLLDEQIDEAFVEEHIIADTKKPAKRPFAFKTFSFGGKRLGVSAVAASTTLGLAATVTAVLVARRLRTPKAAVYPFGKPGRHYGYGRYHFGRLGKAYLAYTYKLPEVRLQLPKVTYTFPPMHVKVPTIHR